MVNNLTNKRCLTFSEEEVPKEGRRHNQPLHISVKCGEYLIARVLIDNGSSLNVLPKSTLDKLCSINSQLRTNSVVIRAFDGSKREVIGEITLPIYVGPTMFNTVFQLMDICPAYSCLLGRPWIHTASAALEIANSENISFTSTMEKMAIRVMIKEGYQPGKGLGPHLNGIPTPIMVQENKGRTRLGYRGDDQGEYIALVEIEKWIEQEKPKFQPWAEELESVNLGDEKEKKEVKVGKQMPLDLRIELIELLKEYFDIFAWSYRDMSGLNREIVEHKLPLLPNATPVRQQL
ncbi:hypothetical protein CR513_26189, partial [Mucuna pruriens]